MMRSCWAKLNMHVALPNEWYMMVGLEYLWIALEDEVKCGMIMLW